jgi:hypothetical protein
MRPLDMAAERAALQGRRANATGLQRGEETGSLRERFLILRFGLRIGHAWWLRRRTKVSLRWLREELSMGHLSRVSQAIGQINRRPGRKHDPIKRLLSRTAGKEAATRARKAKIIGLRLFRRGLFAGAD